MLHQVFAISHLSLQCFYVLSNNELWTVSTKAFYCNIDCEGAHDKVVCKEFGGGGKNCFQIIYYSN